MPLEDLRLLARDTCVHCVGTGQQLTEDWQGFETWADRRRLTDLARDEAIEHYFLEVCDLNAVPAVREDCTACGGRGSLEIEIPVRQLLELIVERFDAPIVARAELDEVVDTLKTSMTSAALKSQGLADPLDAGSWLRVCQEAAESLRAVAELRPKAA